MRRAIIASVAVVFALVSGEAASGASPTPHYFYRLAYESNAHVDLGVVLQGQPSAGDATAYTVAAALTGQLAAHVVATGPDGTVLLVRVTGTALRVVTNGQDQIAQCDEVKALLARGVMVTLAADGRVLTVRLGPSASAFAGELIRSIAASMQFVGPGPGKSLTGRWVAREQDPIGEYEARYEARPPVRGDLVVLKLKDSYLDPPQNNQAQRLPGRRTAVRKVRPDMTVWAHFDATGRRLTSLDGAESQTTTLDGREIGQGTSRIQLLARPAGRAAPFTAADRALIAGLSVSPALAILQPEDPLAEEAAAQRRALGNATVTQLLSELAAAGDSDAALDAVYLKLKALVFLHPEDDGALAAVLMTADPHGKPFQVLSRALGAISDAPAQAALSDVIRHRAGDAAALAALAPALAGAPDPTPAAEATLRGLLADPDPAIVQPALLALGGMARQLAEGGQEARSRAVVDRLLALLAATTGDLSTADVLQSLGNAGVPQIAAPVLERLSSPSAIVRAAALDALRNLATPEVERRLLAVLTGDTDAHVRYEAAFALGVRDRSAAAVAGQIAAFAKEPDDYVRGALLTNLSGFAATSPEVRALIENAAANDTSRHVRDRARGILDQPGGLKP